ncbi:MAG: hypothetical protein GW942_00170 [Candidatus Pacebacteria bacterium]|nr:hypothetical protein [Candidatus Paceibacterota bacterium]
MNKANSRASSLVSGLRASFSSGAGLQLGNKVNASLKSDPVNPPQNSNNNLGQSMVTDQDQLDTLDQVITQIETEKSQSDPKSMGYMAQAMPQAVAQIQDSLNPLSPASIGSTKKEAYVVGSGVAIEGPVPTVEHPGGVQSVEQEPNPEISPEVESFLQHAQEQSAHLPQEIVVADDQAVSAVTHYPKKPVVVLPITPEDQKKGKNKSPKLSIRWLVEWSVKIMKKFTGEVIYREEK